MRVTGPQGTARRARLGELGVAGKTGTAEVRGRRRNNLWFAGYLPHEDPRLAIACVFWDGPVGMHGGDVAAVAVADLLRRMRETKRWSGLFRGRGR